MICPEFAKSDLRITSQECPVKKKSDMIKTPEAKEFGNVAANEEKYEQTDNESTKEGLDFNQKGT